MFGFGTPEIIVILGIALVVIGPGKLPQVAASLGDALRSFKRATEVDLKLLDPRSETGKEPAVSPQKTAAVEPKRAEA